MNKSKNERRIIYSSKNTKRKNFKKYQKKKFIKFFYVFILFIFYTLFTKYNPRSSHDISEKENDSYYDWRENAKKMMNKYFSIIDGTNCYELNEDINIANDYLNFPEYKEDNNSVYNIEIKEKFIQEILKRYGKDLRKVKIIVVLNSVFFGNHMIGLSNIIYYCEILGIKNLYLNSKYDFFIKNDIITDKIHISIKSIDTLNCSSQDIFCGRLFDDFYFPKVIQKEGYPL